VRIVIYVGKYEDFTFARLIMNKLIENKLRVVGARELEGRELGIDNWDHYEPDDVALVLGGDGSVLRFLHEREYSVDTPILHIGTGRVNFLSDSSPRELPHVIDKLIKGEYYMEERLTLRAISGEYGCVALNEIAVKALDPGRLMTVTIVEEHGEEVMRARMDGVLVSTPTGSTAYALAAGGPMLDNRVRAKLVVPLAPFSRAIVPIVHPLDVPIGIFTTDRANIICDGVRSWMGAEVTVKPGEKSVKFIRTRRHRTYEKLWRRAFIP